MILWFMSRCHNKDISNNVIFAFKMSLLRERHLMTVVISTSYSRHTVRHVMVMKVSCRSYAHPFK